MTAGPQSVEPGRIELAGVHKHFRLKTDASGSLRGRFAGRRDTHRDFWALRGIDLSVEPGEMLGLIGHNGSGKSTLLRVIGGVYRPTVGTSDAGGRVAALLELGAGFHPDLTGRENIGLNASILGLSDAEVAEVADEILAFAEIGEFIDSPVGTYSSGMKARLGFAVSAFTRPDVLLADEIIAVGDARFAARCMAHLREMRARGTTVVLVSHSLHLVESLCDRVAWLDHGELLATGEPSEVIARYIDHMAVRMDGGTADRSVAEDGAVVGPLRFGGPGGAPLVLSGGPLEASFELSVPTGIAQPEVVLRCYHDGATLSLGCRSGVLESLEPGRRAVSLRVPHLPLPPGTYRVDVALRGAVVGGHDRLAATSGELVVAEAPEPLPEGMCDLAGSWVIDGALPGRPGGPDR